MGLGGVLFATAAAQAVTSISQGYAQKSENNYNATLLEGKANLIDEQGQIQSGQYDRLKGETLSTSMATVAKQGIAPQGSALAVMLNAQTQINIDQSIAAFNNQQDKNQTMAEAAAQRRAGSAAVNSGYSGAFSALLNGASTYATYKLPMNNSSFDYGKAPSNTAPFVKPKLNF